MLAKEHSTGMKSEKKGSEKMAKKLEVYKCEICGNIVEVLLGAAGRLVCCGEPMSLMKEKKKDTGVEKHLPVVVIEGAHISIRVGDVPHPMVEEHHIQWIEVLGKNGQYRVELHPGDEPRVELDIGDEVISVRSYCNLHGLWRSEI